MSPAQFGIEFSYKVIVNSFFEAIRLGAMQQSTRVPSELCTTLTRRRRRRFQLVATAAIVRELKVSIASARRSYFAWKAMLVTDAFTFFGPVSVPTGALLDAGIGDTYGKCCFLGQSTKGPKKRLIR